MHWMMPPQNRIVEVMTDGQTDERVFPFLSDRLKEIGYLPANARKRLTGFGINRMWAAIKREALIIVSQGVATPEELDSAWAEMFAKNAAGPCKMMDAIGLDTVSFIEQHYAKERNLPTEDTVGYLQKYIDKGRLGTKSSKGGLYPPGQTQQTLQDSEDHYDALHGPTLYFLDVGLSNSPKTFLNKGRILTGGTNGRPLKTLVDGQHMPDGIAISLKLGKLFWTSMGIATENDGCVLSSNLDGSNIQTIIPQGKIHTGKQITIDRVNKKLYFCDREGLRVMRCNGDGSEHEILVQNGDWHDKDQMEDQMRWCVGVTVSPSTGQFYWTQKGYSKSNRGKIMRANIELPTGQDATNRTDIECVLQKLPEPIDLECDEEDHILYWSDRGEQPIGNSINRAPLSKLKSITDPSVQSVPDEDYELIARNMHEAIGLAVDTMNKHIYCTDLGGTLYRFNMDGSGRRKYYDGEGSFTGLTLAHV